MTLKKPKTNRRKVRGPRQDEAVKNKPVEKAQPLTVVWRAKTAAELAALPEEEQQCELALQKVHENPELKAWYDLFNEKIVTMDRGRLKESHAVGMMVVELREKMGHNSAAIVAAAIGGAKDYLSRAESFARYFTMEDVEDICSRAPKVGWSHFYHLSSVADKDRRDHLVMVMVNKGLRLRGLLSLIHDRDEPKAQPALKIRSFAGGVSNAQAKLSDISRYLGMLDPLVFDPLEKLKKGAPPSEDFLESAKTLQRSLHNVIESLSIRKGVVDAAVAKLFPETAAEEEPALADTKDEPATRKSSRRPVVA